MYRLLAPDALAGEIHAMQELVEQSYPSLRISQDLGLGMMLWLLHFFPREPWARSSSALEHSRHSSRCGGSAGYFCREPGSPHVKFAFTNYGVSLGLRAVAAYADRVSRLNAFFASYRSGDSYDTDAIAHVMGCTSYLPGDFNQEETPKSV